jgi:uncharacterized coiled-coil DUF342 family protein
MEEKHSNLLEDKIQQLIDNFRSLKKDHSELTTERDNLFKLSENNSATIIELKRKIAELEDQLVNTRASLEVSQQKCNEFEQKINNFENVTKTASTKIDDILAQLTVL